YSYDGAGHTTAVQADLPGGGIQQTKFNYGVTLPGVTGIYSYDILGSIDHPDKSTGSASSSEREIYTVNALGEKITYQDQNQTVHAYSYDVVVRFTADAVTIPPGSSVDSAVQRIEVGYDGQGNAALFTSFASPTGGAPVNQVQRAYNGLGQLTVEYQEHAR